MRRSPLASDPPAHHTGCADQPQRKWKHAAALSTMGCRTTRAEKFNLWLVSLPAAQEEDKWTVPQERQRLQERVESLRHAEGHQQYGKPPFS